VTGTPRTGDRVRWTHTSVIEGRVDRVEVDAIHLQDEASGRIRACQFEGATVEVLERADDPTLDPIWTVREVEPKPAAAMSNVVVKFGNSYWLYPSNLGNGYGRLDWATVHESKVIGAVPGTDAARFEDAIADLVADSAPRPSVRVPNEPHGLSLFVHRQVANLVAVGNAGAASLLLQETGMPADEANDYVKTLAGDVS
jgi:hypothetical protein